jgi:hypothetical protein
MSSSITDAQLQNWENFCRHHAIGDWYGTWNIYDLEGKLIRQFKCIRSFQVTADGNEINHQNYYIYPDNTTKLETFQPRKKPNKEALFLETSFSWGSTEVKASSIFFFEIGFRNEDRRRSAVVRYNEDGTVDILIISEHLGSFSNESPLPLENQLDGWEGIATSMTPNDCIVSPTQAILWMPLEDLNKKYLTLHLQNGISISVPHQIESGQNFFLAAEWLVNPTLLQRSIRHFDTSEFISFTLEVFKRPLKG